MKLRHPITLGLLLCGAAILPCHGQESANQMSTNQESANTADTASAINGSSAASEPSLGSETSSLPDAPSTTLAETADSTTAALSFNDQRTSPTPQIAGLHTRIIRAGVTAPRLSVGDKILLGLANATSLKAAAGWVASATYSEAFDTSPNYGQTAKGYLQRLGAAAARSSSEGIFSDSILAPALGEDPRYYVMGKGHNVGQRLIYAVTRTFVTRTDAGTATPNYSLLGGNLAGAALTQAYYPAVNTGFGPTMKTFGTSLGGSAVSFVVDEFFLGTIERISHKAL